MGKMFGENLHLLHQGVDGKTFFGSVTVIFDNSDSQLVGFDDKEIIIKREFGETKDEIYLNGKKITKKYLNTIVEAIGFSKSQPYYFVKQHEVSIVAKMDNFERLKVFKEVAGVRLYEERRKEVETCILDGQRKSDALSAAIKSISDKLVELNIQQKDKENYLACEKKKKVIEHILNERKISKIKEELIKHEKLLEQYDMDIKEINQETARIVQTLDSQKTTYDIAKKKKNIYEEDLQKLITKKKKLTLDLENIDAQLTSESKKSSNSTYMNDLTKYEHLQKEIAVEQDKLRTSKKKYDKIMYEILPKTSTKDASNTLNEKKKLNDIERQIHILQSSITATLEKNEKIKHDLIEKRKKCIFNSKGAIESKLLAELESVTTEMQICRSNLEKTNERLQQTMKQSNLNAYLAAEKWRSISDNNQVAFGTLLENITVDPKYLVPVETASGNQLFNYLVKDRYAAQDLVQFIKENYGGSTTIVPLEETRKIQKKYKYPPESDTMRPLISVISYSDVVAPAVEQVFGSYLLIDNINSAIEYSKKGFNCITPEGDTCLKNGIITGGYRPALIRIQYYSQIKDLEAKLHNLQETHQKLSTELLEMTASTTQTEIEAEKLQLELNEIQFAQADAQNLLCAQEIELNYLVKRKIELEEFLRDPLSLDHYYQSQEIMPSENPTLIKELKESENEIQQHEINLSENLIPQATLLQTQMLQNTVFLDEPMLSLELEREKLVNEVSKVQHEIDFLNDQITSIKSEALKLQQNENSLKIKDIEYKEDLAHLESKKQLKYSEIINLKNNFEELQQNQQKIAGSKDLVDHYIAQPSVKLNEELAQISKKINEIHYNDNKAISEISEFEAEISKLTQERDKLAQDEKQLENLIKTFDSQKKEMFLKFFDDMNKEFQLIFSKIVPNGKSILKLIKKDPIAQSVLEDNIENEYSGIKISVKFNPSAEYTDLEQLSGGQKTCVSIAFLFALQRVDSVPFYILDEIDANLDAQYRENVANFFKECSEKNQIITISHREELKNVADQIINVSMHNQFTNIAISTPRKIDIDS